MKSRLFSAWRMWDQHHPPTPQPLVSCPMCSPETTSKATLIDLGFGEDEALYQCAACEWHGFVVPHYLNWPSYKTQVCVGRWSRALIFFFTVAMHWHIRTWRTRLSTCFFWSVYQLAHRSAHWAIATMRQDYQGNVIGHTILSRLIGIVEAVLFSLSLPHVGPISQELER